MKTEKQVMDSESKQKKVSELKHILLELLDDFPNHPFKVRDDEDMLELIESVTERGVLIPAMVRPKENRRTHIRTPKKKGKLWKKIRKYGACVTDITQNVEDILQSHTARTMLSNSEFVVMLNQAAKNGSQAFCKS